MSETPPIALEDRSEDEGRLFSPSAARNVEPIMQAFVAQQLNAGRIIEVGAGTGQHAAHIVAANEHIESWTSVEPDAASRVSCEAWARHMGVSDRLIVCELDASTDWAGKFDRVDAIYSANVIHISPIIVLDGLVRGAGELLASGGRLVLYGPFSRDGAHTSDSNLAFDQSLKSRNADWGVRDLERDVIPRAGKHDLILNVVNDMPANNQLVIFTKI